MIDLVVKILAAGRHLKTNPSGLITVDQDGARFQHLVLDGGRGQFQIDHIHRMAYMFFEFNGDAQPALQPFRWVKFRGKKNGDIDIAVAPRTTGGTGAKEVDGVYAIDTLEIFPQ